MKMMRKLSTTFLLTWTLLCVLPNAYADITHSATINFLLNSKNHPYFLKAYTNKEFKTLRKLYQLNQSQLLWFSSKRPLQTIDQLLELYNNAADHGLTNTDYASHYLKSQWQKIQQSNPDFHEFAVFDTALSLTFLRYLTDLHYGRVAPEQYGFQLQPKKAIDFASHIFGAIQTNSILALAERMAPVLSPYQQLKTALAQYRRLNQYFEQPIFFNYNRTLRPGDWSTQVSELNHYLDALGSPVNQPIVVSNKASNIYSEDIVTKIRQLQTNHNLPSDGIIGKQTFEVLNTPLNKRIKQIELAMERLRWLPEQQPGPIILVNIPAFQLWAYNPEQRHGNILNMKVVVGKAINRAKNKTGNEDKALQTPVFSAKLSYIVFNPYWNIPKSILTNEILPLIEEKPGYLQRNNMEIVPRFSHHAPVLPINSENISRLSNGQLFLRQRPGPGNALGHIKFIFPNNHKVYLHDTPALSLFKRTQRDFSHGCIRVENPNALARFVLQEQPEWDNTKIQQTIDTKKPSTVDIPQKIPVLIFYTTALVTTTGTAFYPDIYDHDSTLQSALTERSHLLAISTLATRL